MRACPGRVFGRSFVIALYRELTDRSERAQASENVRRKSFLEKVREKDGALESARDARERSLTWPPAKLPTVGVAFASVARYSNSSGGIGPARPARVRSSTPYLRARETE